MSFLTFKKKELISWQVDLVRVDLVAIDLVRIDLVKGYLIALFSSVGI